MEVEAVVVVAVVLRLVPCAVAKVAAKEATSARASRAREVIMVEGRMVVAAGAAFCVR